MKQAQLLRVARACNRSTQLVAGRQGNFQPDFENAFRPAQPDAQQVHPSFHDMVLQGGVNDASTTGALEELHSRS